MVYKDYPTSTLIACRQYHSRRRLLFIFIGLSALLYWLSTAAGPAIYAQEPLTWSTPVVISEADTLNWFADIAVDIYGTPHVIWDGGLTPSDKLAHPKTIISLLMQTQLDGDTWRKPLDVVAVMHGAGRELDNMPQAALSADHRGNLLLWYAGGLHTVSAAQANDSAANWSDPYEISRSFVYSGNALMDKAGIIHVLYDEPTLLENPIGRGINKTTHMADIYYRRSLDNGQTWSSPLNLSRTQIGESRASLEIDTQDVLYAIWDEGWDRRSNDGDQKRSGLSISRDGGRSWSPKTTFSLPDQSNAQLAVAGDGQGNVLAVWRATTRKQIFYSWSTDRGESWSVPQAIPYIFARVWDDTGLDSYDLAVDSAGVIHLAAVGRLQRNLLLSQLYHLSWDGETWSKPHLIYKGSDWPEQPRLAISQGNRLHLVWFVRGQLDLDYFSRYQVWYSQVTVDAPAVPLPATPSSTPQPAPTAPPTVNLTPTVPKSAITDEELEAIRGINTEAMISNDDLPMLLGKSLAPLALLVAGIGLGRHFLRSRNRRGK